MKRRQTSKIWPDSFAFSALLCATVALLTSGGCGNADDGGDDDVDAAADSDAEGLRQCCILGEVCHEVDDRDGPLSACHDVGHQNDPTACRAAFERCIAQCVEAGADETMPALCE